MPRMTSGLRRKYNAHINSAKWRNLRREVVRMRGLRCERCGRLKGRLCLHHLSYARFGNETPDQVQLLCCKCHKPADQERRGTRVMINTAFAARDLCLIYGNKEPHVSSLRLARRLVEDGRAQTVHQFIERNRR